MKSTRRFGALCLGLALSLGAVSAWALPAAAAGESKTSTHGYDEKFLSALSWRCPRRETSRS